MSRRTNKYIPVMLNSVRSRKSGWKIAFLALLAIVAVVVVVLVLGNRKVPFSTVTPSTTPVEAVSATPEEPSDEVYSVPGEEGEAAGGSTADENADSAENPVETLLSAYQEAYTQSEKGFLKAADAYSLKLLSFRLALAQANGTLIDACSYFVGLDRGETPGEWSGGNASIAASSGSYVLSATFSTGSKIEGTVSSTMTRLTCTVFDTDGETAIRTVELVKGSDGYYVQIWDRDGVYVNTRYMTGSDGLNCAIGDAKQDPVYDAVPISWSEFSGGNGEAVRCTTGGAIITENGQETICNLS